MRMWFSFRWFETTARPSLAHHNHNNVVCSRANDTLHDSDGQIVAGFVKVGDVTAVYPTQYELVPGMLLCWPFDGLAGISRITLRWLLKCKTWHERCYFIVNDTERTANEITAHPSCDDGGGAEDGGDDEKCQKWSVRHFDVMSNQSPLRLCK